MALTNRAVVFDSVPDGLPTDCNFRIVDGELPTVEDGQVLIRTLYLSADPYMRERMTLMKSYMAPFEVGGVIDGTLIGTVVESRHTDFYLGEVVYGFLKWQEYNISDGTGLSKVSKDIGQYQLALGTLGSPGITGYVGLIDVGQLKRGETVVVSGAGGAVGSVAVQLAKQYGCRVVGITGSDEKNRYLRNHLGVDVAINYKTAGDMEAALAAACPDGIDVYFDNVGNDILNAVADEAAEQIELILTAPAVSVGSSEAPHVQKMGNRQIRELFLFSPLIMSLYT